MGVIADSCYELLLGIKDTLINGEDNTIEDGVQLQKCYIEATENGIYNLKVSDNGYIDELNILVNVPTEDINFNSGIGPCEITLMNISDITKINISRLEKVSIMGDNTIFDLTSFPAIKAIDLGYYMTNKQAEHFADILSPATGEDFWVDSYAKISDSIVEKLENKGYNVKKHNN
jgi:hypothetical protein